MHNEDEEFYAPGDTVVSRHDMGPKPKMIVKTIDKVKNGRDNRANLFLGITCWWYTADLQYQEHRFNSKDLTIVKCARDKDSEQEE